MALAGGLCAAASAQVRVASYNVVGLLGDQPSLRAVIASFHTDDRPGFATAAGVLVFCEVRASTIAALQSLVNQAAPPGVTYALATFTTSGSEDSSSGAQAAFYRTDLLAEVTSGHLDIATGAGRNTDRWLFRLNGYSSAAARFYVYGAHLKASTGTTNEATRLSGVQAIRANADALGTDVRALYAGDMNFYSSAESGYQAFGAAGNGRAVDPLGTADWAGAANAWKHTQSPRDIVANGLVGGGMDDRFDFILPTAQLCDGSGIAVIPGTYRVPGNDGAHYNLAVNAGNNAYFPGNLARSNLLADQLFAAADHLPVLVDLQVPAWSTASLAGVPARVIQGATASVEVRVANDAPGDTAAGIDALDFVASGSGVLAGSVAGTAALTPSFTSVSLPVATGVVGLRAGTATVSSSSEAVENPVIALPCSIRVLRRSNPSFSQSADVDSVTVPFVATAGGPPVEAVAAIWNWGHSVDQATMDVDGIDVPAGRFTVVGGVGSAVAGLPGELRFRFDPQGLAPGTYAVTAAVRTSDENVPGATAAVVSVLLSATVGGGRPADLNLDGKIDGGDLALLLSAWGGPGPGDLDADGTVSGVDLTILLGNWG